jgi:DNA topoisomerase I
VRIGRFGPYVQLGQFDKTKKTDKPKTAALPKKTSIEQVTIEQAIALLAFPRDLGRFKSESLTVNLGRFGPYIRCGKITAAIADDIDPALISREDVLAMLAQAKEERKQSQKPLKSLGKDPNTGGEILVKDGRYGPYITDGKTNASLGKKYTPEDVTFEQAVDILAKKRSQPKRRK